MEGNGWTFSWDDQYDWRPVFCSGMLLGNIVRDTGAYCGFQWPGDGSVSRTLSGSGSFSLVFGNNWFLGAVVVYLDDWEIARANPLTPHLVSVTHSFTDGAVLRVTEEQDSIMVISGLTFSDCAGSGKPGIDSKPGLAAVKVSGYHYDNRDFFDGKATLTQATISTFNPYGDEGSDYSWKWQGSFKPPTSGTYEFFTRSDDGSHVYIGKDGLMGHVVNNGGLHGMRERTGSAKLTEGQIY